MTNLRRAFLVSAAATGAAAAVWMVLARIRATNKTARSGAARRPMDRLENRTRADEIEELTQQQKDLMLRELSEHF